MSYIREYLQDIKIEKIIAGRELTAQLELLILMMEDPDYRYDTQEAEKRIKFIETHCKHSVSPFAGKPFILELWQKAFVEACYSFYILSENKWIRYYTYALLVVARKNGKSPFASAIALAEYFCGNKGTNITCGSNDYESAGIVYDEINNMREESRSLEKVTRKTVKGVFFGNPKQKKKTGKFSKQNKAKIKKISAKTQGKEGRNLDLGIIDESHEMKDESLVMPMKQAVSTKDESLIIEITTEGFVEGGHLDESLKTARLTLAGKAKPNRTLYFLYTQDSEIEIWTNPESWYKSNPNLGVSKKRKYLEDFVEEAKTSNQIKAFVLAKDFNIKQNSAVSWLNIQDYTYECEFNIEELKNCWYIAGNDFAETTDLCSSTVEILKNGIFYNYTRYWITKNKLEHSEDEFDYKNAVKEGWIYVVDDSNISSDIVADWHYELYQKYGLKPFKIGIDQRSASAYKTKAKLYFGDDVLVNIPQYPRVLHNPMKMLEYDLKNKRELFENNPVTRWCLGNTGLKIDSKGFMQPTKIKSNKRIDGTASTITAKAVYKEHAQTYDLLNK